MRSRLRILYVTTYKFYNVVNSLVLEFKKYGNIRNKKGKSTPTEHPLSFTLRE